MSTTDNSATAPFRLSGNDFAPSIYGNAGDNVIDGGGGPDGMSGFGGNDWYFIDDPNDVIIEHPGEGTADRAFAGVSYNLTPGADIEIMSTTDHAGTTPLNLRGNELAQTVYGNAGDNILSGGYGNDMLVG